MTQYQDHPFAAIWPLMEGVEFEKLVADIKANGLHQPILLYQNQILDGRNRDRACIKAEIEPRYERARATNSDEALDLVVSLNNHRRHMTVAQRGFAAARLANLKHGSSQHRKVDLSNDISLAPRDPRLPGHRRSVRDAAYMMDVSTGTVARARTVITHAPELEKQILAGKLALVDAANKIIPARLKAQGKTTQAAKKTARAAQARQAAYQRALENRASLPKARFLSPQEVDPDFKGTSTEFLTMHGHVNTRTAAQKEREAAEKRVHDLMVCMLRCIENAPAEISETDLLEWIRGTGDQPGYRRDKLAKRWIDFDNLHARFSALMAQLESQMTGKPIEVRR